jgi:hypothetical protein
VFVEERAARRKIQQRGASHERQRAAHNRPSESGFPRVHEVHFSVALSTGGNPDWFEEK